MKRKSVLIAGALLLAVPAVMTDFPIPKSD